VTQSGPTGDELRSIAGEDRSFERETPDHDGESREAHTVEKPENDGRHLRRNEKLPFLVWPSRATTLHET